MENAGAAVASLSRELLGGVVEGKRVCVIAGKGNNGGDGLVAARHLHNWGGEVSLRLSDRAGMGVVPRLQLASVEKMGIDATGGAALIEGQDLVIDALLGYSAAGPPRGAVGELIAAANASGVPIIAVDVPSGLDATTGVPYDPCVAASATLALGFPKTGFLNPASKRVVGDLYLADVSIPAEVYRRRSQPPPFSKGTRVRLP
jgi:hydroxyethylthiazole kinase-like uncharacterized protein yjeF